MRKVVLVAMLLFMSTSAMAEHLLIKGGYYIRNVDILSRKGDVVEYRETGSNVVRTIHIEYIDRVSELEPEDRKVLTPQNLEQHLGKIERQAKKDKVIEVNSLEAACDLYAVNKKDPYLAMGLAAFVPSLGHAYAGDWSRGQIFIVLDILLIGSFFIPIKDDEVAAFRPLAATMLSFIFKSFEMYDAVKTADDYNEQLRKDLKVNLGVDERGIRLDLKY